jgi:uncharacterized protein
MKDWETKDFKFSVSDLNDELGTFTGYASIFGAVDSYSDIVEKGAFKKSIRDNGQFPLLWSHDVSTPIGVITPKEDATGLKVMGHLNLDVQRGREIRSLMKQGAIQGLSIGYQVVKSAPDEVDKAPVRKLQEVKLWEISPVVFGACPGAIVAAVKGEEPPEDKATWDSAYVNALPNAAFAVVEPGYKDGDNKGARHLPHHDKSVQSATEDSSVDEPHLRNALARMNQISAVLDGVDTAAIRAKAKSHLVGHAKRMGIGDWGKAAGDVIKALIETEPDEKSTPASEPPTDKGKPEDYLHLLDKLRVKI